MRRPVTSSLSDAPAIMVRFSEEPGADFIALGRDRMPSPNRLEMALPSLPTSSGDGYFMSAADGGLFAFGAATFAGSTGGQPIPGPIVGLAST